MELSLSGSLHVPAEAPISGLFASGTIRRIKTGETLFQAGEPGDGCYRLDSGFLKVSAISPQVNERILTVLAPGAVVGTLAMIDGQPRSASVIALSESELRFISQAAFERATREHPEIYHHLAKLVSARLRQANDTVAFCFWPAKARVARVLLVLAEALGTKAPSGEMVIPRIINQGDIAAMAGLARENTNRLLSEWDRQRLVSKSAGSYRIHDTAKLRRETDV